MAYPKIRPTLKSDCAAAARPRLARTRSTSLSSHPNAAFTLESLSSALASRPGNRQAPASCASPSPGRGRAPASPSGRSPVQCRPLPQRPISAHSTARRGLSRPNGDRASIASAPPLHGRPSPPMPPLLLFFRRTFSMRRWAAGVKRRQHFRDAILDVQPRTDGSRRRLKPTRI